MFTDKVLRCCDCTNDFVFTEGEQEFFHAKGLSNLPKRCSDCRVITRLRRAGRAVDTVSQAVCAKCESSFTLPFKPLGYKPTFCNTCFRLHRAEMEAARNQTAELVLPVAEPAVATV